MSPQFDFGEHAHALRRDRYDDLAWAFASEDVPELAETARGPLGLGLVQDAHASLLRARPELDPEGGASPRHRALIEEMLGTREWATLHERTRGDDAAAALGTLEMARILTEKLAKMGSEKVNEIGVSLQPELDALRQASREACRVALQAVEQADQAEAALSGRGRGTEPGTPSRTDRRALLEARDAVRRSKRGRGVLEAILREAGRLRRIRDRVRATRSRRGPGCVVGIETGADPARLLPVELVALAPGAPPALALDFARRFSERQLLQLRTREEAPVGRGPIVLCLDQSGSMSGTLEVWSKALCLALLELASAEGRAFAYLPFSDGVGKPWAVPAGARPEAGAILERLESFMGGGTDFERPLRAALDAIEACPGQLRHADVVFVTDGLCPVSAAFAESFRARTRARETKLYSILLGVGQGACDLEPLSASVVRVVEISKDGDAEALDSAFSVGL